MITDYRLSKDKACRIVGLSRTALCRTRVDWFGRDKQVIDAITDVIAKPPRRGFWKCHNRLRLDGHPVNHKRVHRVYCEMKLNM
jgi:putative transposase